MYILFCRIYEFNIPIYYAHFFPVVPRHRRVPPQTRRCSSSNDNRIRTYIYIYCLCCKWQTTKRRQYRTRLHFTVRGVFLFASYDGAKFVTKRSANGVGRCDPLFATVVLLDAVRRRTTTERKTQIRSSDRRHQFNLFENFCFFSSFFPLFFYFISYKLSELPPSLVEWLNSYAGRPPYAVSRTSSADRWVKDILRGNYVSVQWLWSEWSSHSTILVNCKSLARAVSIFGRVLDVKRLFS